MSGFGRLTKTIPNLWLKRCKLWLWLTVASIFGGNLAVWLSFHHLPKWRDDILAACVSTLAVGILARRNAATE